MTDQDRHGALLNVKFALEAMRGYVGVSARLGHPLTPEQMENILSKAKTDLDALYIEAAFPGGPDGRRPEGTRITGENSAAVVVYEKMP